MSISLVWIGFSAGLFGPAALGREGSWESMDSAVGTAVDPVVYTIDLDYINLPADLGDFWSTQPGPYIASRGNQIFVAGNSSLAPNLLVPGHADFSGGIKEGGEVAIGVLSPAIGGELRGFANISEIDSRIQHVRDLQIYKDLFLFSNIELKSNCMVLQVWTAELSDDGAKTNSVKNIWQSNPCLGPRMSPEGIISSRQSGGRISLEGDGSVLLSVGDFRLGLSDDREFEGRPDPLKPGSSYGKILRVQPCGGTDSLSSGHRNPQGLFFDSTTSHLWISEPGPNAGGELNLIIEGADHGWPDTSYGVPYGPNLPQADCKISRWGSHHEGFEKPVLAWMPSIAPSQVIQYQSEHFPAWRGDILLATLRDQSLRRIRLDGDRVLFDERIEIGERVRDLVELHDGRLLLSFDSG